MIDEACSAVPLLVAINSKLDILIDLLARQFSGPVGISSPRLHSDDSFLVSSPNSVIPGSNASDNLAFSGRFRKKSNADIPESVAPSIQPDTSSRPIGPTGAAGRRKLKPLRQSTDLRLADVRVSVSDESLALPQPKTFTVSSFYKPPHRSSQRSTPEQASAPTTPMSPEMLAAVNPTFETYYL